MAIFYDFSGGMESAAMLIIERDRIVDAGAIVRLADTGKQFPEFYSSFRQVEHKLGIFIQVPKRKFDFDEFLFERGGIIRKGTTDCSRRMKRRVLARHMQLFPKPWEVNIGFNCDEQDRADEFVDLNERPWLHWRFPLIEAGINRQTTEKICRDFGLTILVEMYKKMGRMDCFWCGNQKPEQALRVVDNYPMLAREWMEAEERKGHSFMTLPLRVLVEHRDRQGLLDFGPQAQAKCACFGGNEAFIEEQSWPWIPKPMLRGQEAR